MSSSESVLTDSKLIVPVPSWLQLSEQHAPILPGLVANISHLHPHLNDSPHSSCSLPLKERNLHWTEKLITRRVMRHCMSCPGG